MGVSGSGKSTVGAALAARLNWPFVDGDDLHPRDNIAKMSRGEALDDGDRRPWLRAIGEVLSTSERPVVLACSALRRVYRDIIREGAPTVYFLHLDGAPEIVGARLAGRAQHFMPPSLLASQLALVEPLEPDEAGSAVGIDASPSAIVDVVLRRMSLAAGDPENEESVRE
jgi:carbohydrate kinase (thermoresistant glucokinase family)